MALFNRSDMQYSYNWTAKSEGDDPKVTGQPDSTRFDRHEGYEMLYIVNKLAEIWSFKKVESCKKMEYMIREHLPSKMVMQKDVRNWIHEHWNKI